MRKGQGLSMNVVIIAAIALVVLVVLVFVLLNGTKGLNRGTSCEAFNGKCYPEGTYCPSTAHPFVGGYSCSEKSYVCCVAAPAT